MKKIQNGLRKYLEYEAYELKKASQASAKTRKRENSAEPDSGAVVQEQQQQQQV